MPIMFNSSNYVANSTNTFTYNFPTSATFTQGDQVALSLISMYNSTFNISSALGNNTCTIIFNSATPITVNVTFPDGNYACSDLNYYLQGIMIANNLYVTNAQNLNVYFLELVIAPVYYAIELNCYPLCTSAQATTLGYTQPSGASWSYPSVAQVCQLNITSNLSSIIGFTQSTFPSSIGTAEVSFLSSVCPVISPVSCYMLTCNLINDPLSSPNNMFYSVPINASFGNLISTPSNQLVWNNIQPNTYNSITIQFYDQLLNKLNIRDIEVVINLVIRRLSDR